MKAFWNKQKRQNKTVYYLSICETKTLRRINFGKTVNYWNQMSLFIDHHHLQSSIFTTRTLRWAATSSVKSISEITLFSPLCNSRSYVLTVPMAMSFKVLKYFSCDKISLSLLTCFESFQTGDKLVNVFFRKFWLAQQ